LISGFTLTGGTYEGSGSPGGAIRGKDATGFNESSASAVVENNTIIDNFSWGYYYTGGAVTLGPNCIIRNNVFINNGAEYGSGAVYVGHDSIIEDNLFSENNNYTDEGGAISSLYVSVIIRRNTFLNNLSGRGSTGRGGAFYGKATLYNNLFAGNSSNSYNDGYGGAAYITGGTFINNTLIDNIGDLQGHSSGIYVDGSAVVANNIIVTGVNGVGLYVKEGVTVTADYNNLWNNDLGSYGGNVLPGDHDIHKDPVFVNPTVDDYHLQAGSACIDAGYNNAPELPSTDKNGDPRIMGAAVDMGAYEYAGTPLPTSTTTTTTTTTSTTTSTTTTLPSPPTVTTGSAVPDSTSATLRGTINPNGVVTTYYFEYGKTSNYGLFTPPKLVGSGTVGISVIAYISGLRQDTSYHYRLVAYNNLGMNNGDDLDFTTSQASTITDSKVIIVAGSGPYAENNIWDEVEMVASYAFAALLYQGYTKDTIAFLSPNTLYDVNGDGIPDVDADATAANLEYAIKTWSQEVSQLVIYLVGHGGIEKFKIGKNEEVSVQSLDTWLDDTQNSMIEQVVVIYDACHSGSFLPLLTPPTGKERIVAASSKSDQNALIAAKGTLSFSYLFWSHIFNGDSFYDSFVSAKNSLAIAFPDRQDSQIEGNGNGIGNEKEDKSLAGLVELGLGVKSAGALPVIGSVSSSPQTVSVGSSAVISAKDVAALEGISKVWAVITPPGVSTTPDGPVVLPILDLLEDNGLYKGTYSDFTTEGLYNVAVFVEDKQGFLSLPVQTTVTVTGGCLSVAGDLSISVPCAEYNGNQYGFILGFYRHPDDPSGYYWNLPMATLTGGTGTDCIPIGSDLSMPFSCAAYNGTQYGFTLRFYHNPYDPSGLYWKMDMSTLMVK